MSKNSIYLGAIAVFGIAVILTIRIGVFGAISLLASFGLLGFLAVWGIVALLIPQQSQTERTLLSILIAPAFIAFSTWLSGITGIYEMRLVPPLFGLMITAVVYLRRKSLLKPINQSQTFKTLYVSWLLGFIVMVPALLVTLSSQKISTGADLNLYNDVPWQTAMVSEALVRAPQFFPFTEGVPLAYPWLFHGFLGGLGSYTNLTAAVLFTAVWPIFYSVLLPLAISFFAWRLTKNFWVTSLSTIGLIFFVGPVLPSTESLRFPLAYSISPTYEFGIISLLTFLIYLTYKEPQLIWGKIASLALLFVVVFATSGSKGSNGLLIVVMVITYFIQSTAVNKRWRFPALQALVAALASITAYTLTISGSSGDLSITPLSFIANAKSMSIPVMFVAVCIVWLAGATYIIFKYSTRRSPALIPSIMGVFSGILFLAMFGHPGFSQLYFYWSIVPVLLVLALWAIVLLFSTFGSIVIVPLFSAWIVASLFDVHISYFFDPTDYAKFKWPLIWLIICTIFVISIKSTKYKMTFNRKFLMLSIAASSVISIAAQPFAAFSQVYSGSKALAGVEIFSDQIETFSYIRTNTDPEAIVATNRHCLAPTAEVIGCDSRYVSLSAFSERRAYIEGHYDLDNQLLRDRLNLNESFIYSPTPSLLKSMWDEGVRYVYIDKTVASAGDLHSVAKLILDTENSQLWKLNNPELK